mgnify:CR=1 FL=1
MQILELYIKGYKRINGSVSSLTTNKLIDTTAQFTIFAQVGDIITSNLDSQSATITTIDSDTQVTLSYDLFPTSLSTLPQYLLTSDYIRVDLFKDESITITDSILNVRDIGKVFTPFSQQFNLPASKANSKLFRHYENENVLNSFDARYRHDAIIKLNGIDYKKGKIQFKSVDLKDNAAYAYKIVFFGDTVELKEILGDTTLGGLIYDPSLNFEYTDANIVAKLQTSQEAASSDVIVANIHHTRNMRIDEEGIYKDYATDQYLQWTDVKPAIRCTSIIEAINATYPEIDIKGFLRSTAFNPLYMWMHKNEGYITNAVEGGDSFVVRNRFRQSSGDWEFQSSSPANIGDARTIFIGGILTRYKFSLQINAGGSTIPYTVRFLNSSTETLIQEWNLEGNFTVFRYFNRNSFSDDILDVLVEIVAENTIALTQVLTVTEEVRDIFASTYVNQWSAVYEPYAGDAAVENTFDIAQQMPKMKVIDFLSGLFKMFNLVVYKQPDGSIMTQRAPYWSNIGNAYDITKYVDMSKSTVERLFQHKEMEFNFKSKKSFLVQFSDDIQNTEFSQEIYPNGGLSNFDGAPYVVELPFEKMMYERLTDQSNGNQSYIQQGAMLDRKFAPTIGEPLLFCPELQENTDSSFFIQLQNGDGLQPNYYNKPTHLFPFPPYAAPQGRSSLNFGIEADEWTGVSPGSSNLFSDGYLDYTQAVFDINSRLLKVSAYLPLSIITKYQMNDTFVINNKPYRINKIKTNLLTNKTDLELYNKKEFVGQIANSEFAFLGRLAQVNATAGSTFVSLGWTPLPNPAANNIQGYSIYIDGNKESDVGFDVSGKTVTGLTSNRSYDILVKVRYNINSEIAYSFGVGQTITTL